MGLKICEKCGEEVDEAKAFCPDCGNPFVEEQKREDSSEFDKYAGTVNFSKSVFKMMLSEMDLDTSKKPEKQKQKRPEKNPIDRKPTEIKTPEINKPENKIPESNAPVNTKPESTPPKIVPSKNEPSKIEPTNRKKKSGMSNWVILGIVGLGLLIILALALLLVLLYVSYS